MTGRDSKSENKCPIAEDRNVSGANGKMILVGEHAAVYGRHALAVPLPQKIRVRITKGNHGVQFVVPHWGTDTHWAPNVENSLSIYRAIDRILAQLGVTQPAIRIVLSPQVPRAVGLGY
jgi:mevalonate kinase